jgi:hypothetical protein
MEDGGWKMEDGGWRMEDEDGGWRMEDGTKMKPRWNQEGMKRDPRGNQEGTKEETKRTTHVSASSGRDIYIYIYTCFVSSDLWLTKSGDGGGRGWACFGHCACRQSSMSSFCEAWVLA